MYDISYTKAENDSQELSNVGIQFRSINPWLSSLDEGNFTSLKAKYIEIKTGSIGQFQNNYYQLALGGGQIGHSHLLDIYGGLTFYNDHENDDTAVGLNIGTTFEWYVSRPASIFFEWATHFQPGGQDEEGSDITNWALNQFDLGGSIHIGSLKVTAGYQWNLNVNFDEILNETYVRGRLYL